MQWEICDSPDLTKHSSSSEAGGERAYQGGESLMHYQQVIGLYRFKHADKASTLFRRSLQDKTNIGWYQLVLHTIA